MTAPLELPLAQRQGYLEFTAQQWNGLRGAARLTLSEAELAGLRGLGEPVSLDEVAGIYLPLVRLLGLRMAAAADLARASALFLGSGAAPPPFVLGIAGSVAVGKSTTARILQTLLTRDAGGRRVELVPTDGFLRSNHELVARGLLARKGFPESYDLRALVAFLSALKAGEPRLEVPVYSHQAYDVVTGARQVVERPDVVLVEGLNVLQPGDPRQGGGRGPFVSDFFDFSVYLDAQERVVESWYVERFLKLRAGAFADPTAYFHAYARLSDDQAVVTARQIWRDINGRNLRDNIAPTRGRADLILDKGADHAVRRVLLRPR